MTMLYRVGIFLLFWCVVPFAYDIIAHGAFNAQIAIVMTALVLVIKNERKRSKI